MTARYTSLNTQDASMNIRSTNKGDNPPSQLNGHLKFIFCLFLHFALLTFHAVLVAVGLNGHPLHLVKDTWYADGFFDIINFGPNIAARVCVLLYLCDYSTVS